MSDLVAKLNEHAFIAATETQHDLCAEAAARIRQLEAELAASRNDEGEAVRAYQALGNSVQEWEARCDALREALVNARETLDFITPEFGEESRQQRKALAAIDAALAAGQEDRT